MALEREAAAGEPGQRCGYRGPFAARRDYPNYVCSGGGVVVVVGRNEEPIEFAGFMRTAWSRTALLCPACGAGACLDCARHASRAPRPALQVEAQPRRR